MKSMFLALALYGLASQYAPGVMQEVINNRQRMNQIPENLTAYDGFIAVRDCKDIGKEYYLYYPGKNIIEKFLAVDCASKSDRQSSTDARSGYKWMLDGNILVEVDYETAERWGIVGRIARIGMVDAGLYESGVTGFDIVSISGWYQIKNLGKVWEDRVKTVDVGSSPATSMWERKRLERIR